MMRILVILHLSLLTIASAWTQADSQWNVLPDSLTIDTAKVLKGGLKGWRDIPWGTPATKVMALEGMKDLGEGALMKDAIFGGVDEVIWLALCGSKGLTAGLYIAVPGYTEPMRYIELYNQWQANLNNKYGHPTIQNENWHNSQWRDEVESGSMSRGWALEMSYLSYNSVWIFEDDSAIALRLDTEYPMMPYVPAIVLGYVKDLKSFDKEKW